MSGAIRTADGEDWYMAHILWQRHGLRMEEFAAMPRHIQLAYIASEEREYESPVLIIVESRLECRSPDCARCLHDLFKELFFDSLFHGPSPFDNADLFKYLIIIYH